MTVTLFVPTLNEAEGVRTILPTVDRSIVQQILVSDAGSEDGTAEIARELGYDVHVQRTPGLRHAFIEAWPMIRGETVITFSPDGNCLTKDIPALVRKMQEGYDMVVASRYLPPARSLDDDWITGFGNWFFTRTVNFLHRGHYTDAMGIFRIYRTALFRELELDRHESYTLAERLFFTRIGCEPLLSARAARAGVRISEIPSDEPSRTSGKRKLQVLRWGAAYYFQFLATLLWQPPAPPR